MKTNQSGEISKILIIIAVVVFVLIIIVFSLIRLARREPSTNTQTENEIETEIPAPEYEVTMQDTRLLFISAEDLGSVLTSETSSYQKPLVTTEKFIKVTIGAQNKGKVNLAQGSWVVGNIVDSEGRNFIPVTQAYYFLPQPNLCGATLKPEFEPTPCTKIYEVSKASENLKITLTATGVGGKKESALIDLDVK